jgi:F420-dependent oxidoreductase-like protein
MTRAHFGVQVWPEFLDSWTDLRNAFQEVEQLGFESGWVYGHLCPMGDNPCLEPWTALSAVAAETKSLRLGVFVACNLFLYPSVLNKIATTLDIISNGRLEFGLGAGWYEKECYAYGIPFPDVKTRIERLEEAAQVIKKMWTEDKPSFKGKHYSINEVETYPKPIQIPHPPIWIAGGGRKVLKIVARYADCCNFTVGVKETEDKIRFLEEECRRIGRDPDGIVKSWHGDLFISEDETKLKQKATKRKMQYKPDLGYGSISLQDFLEGHTIYGTADQCIEKMERYLDIGVDYFIPANPEKEDLKILIEEIAPSL